MQMNNAKQCKLWAGGTLALAYEHKYLTRAMVEDKVTGMKRCDDLTGAEVKLLAALEKDLAE